MLLIQREGVPVGYAPAISVACSSPNFCIGAQVANTVLDAYENGKLQEALQDGAGGFKVLCSSPVNIC